MPDAGDGQGGEEKKHGVYRQSIAGHGPGEDMEEGVESDEEIENREL